MSAETSGATSDFSTRFSAWLRAQYQGYLGILLVGSSARVFGLASQFVVLIILGRMLGKASFGDLMAAFGFYRLVAIAIGTGTSLVILFHVSRRPHDKDFEDWADAAQKLAAHGVVLKAEHMLDADASARVVMIKSALSRS